MNLAFVLKLYLYFLLSCSPPPHHRKKCNTHGTYTDTEVQNCLFSGGRSGEMGVKLSFTVSVSLSAPKVLNCALGSGCFIAELSILTAHSAGRKDCLTYQAKSHTGGTSL